VPRYEVTAPDGRTVVLEGDTPPGDEALAEVFASLPEQKKAPEPDYSTLQNDTQEFRFGPFSTGMEMSPHVTEYLAGLGRRVTQLGTLGMYNDTYEPAEKALDDSGYATAGGITADVAGIALGGSALKTASSVPAIGKGAQYLGQGLTNPQTMGQAVTAAGAYGAATTPDRLEGSAGAAVGGGR